MALACKEQFGHVLIGVVSAKVLIGGSSSAGMSNIIGMLGLVLPEAMLKHSASI